MSRPMDGLQVDLGRGDLIKSLKYEKTVFSNALYNFLPFFVLAVLHNEKKMHFKS